MQNQNEQQSEEYVSGQDYREGMEDLQPVQPQKGITWKHRAAVIFLIIFAASAMILWGVQFANNLQVTKPLSPEEIAKNQQADQTQQKLRTQDTDQDGISDYDELNFYSTSPYLEDTDSDGIDDGREIESGEDPNCPQGQDCFVGSTVDSVNETSGDFSSTSDNIQFTPEQLAELELLLSQTETQGEVVDQVSPSSGGSDRQAMQSVLSGQADADSLRALLDQFGMDSSSLDNIDDSALMRIYGETLGN